LRKIESSLIAEGGYRLSGDRIQADEIGVACTYEDAFIFTLRSVRNATIHETVIGRRSVLPRFGVVFPDWFAGHGFQRRYLRKRRVLGTPLIPGIGSPFGIRPAFSRLRPKKGPYRGAYQKNGQGAYKENEYLTRVTAAHEVFVLV
jgi:hypothetical protein